MSFFRAGAEGRCGRRPGLRPRNEEIVQKIQGVLSSIIDPVLAPLRGIIPP